LDEDHLGPALRLEHLLHFSDATQALPARLRVEQPTTSMVTSCLMRGTFRFLLCLLLSCSIAFAAIPRPPLVSEFQKADCCAMMKPESVTHDCDRPAPKSDQDKQCCALCAFGLALVAAIATPFVYPPVGDETFAAYVSSERSRSQRPPVPPPRA
jgi:hypothetical protein